MTLALRRFRLEGIGPAGARFDPLDVDLTTDGVAARSAVLFLENGGGKSVLLRLLFAVVLPGRRQTLGGAKLEGYVLTGDTGHVALEWDQPDGSRLVTGLVLEWRGRQRSGTAANLLPLWYAFSPREGELTLDDLPTTEAGRRRTRTGFREQLTDLAKAHPRLQLVLEDQPGRWQEHLLSATPLDPEAFRYQRTMNADEGDAESLFAGVRDDDGFVRFVIEAVHDADELASFDDLVAGYATQLARRDALVAEAAFATEAARVLSELATSWLALGDARLRVAETEAEATRLRLALDVGTAEARMAEAAARAEAAVSTQRQAEVESQAKRASALASELRRIEAALLLQRAKDEEAAARAVVDSGRLRVAAWDAVPKVLSRAACEAEAGRLREAQETAERDLAPLRARAEADEGRHAARLEAEATVLDGRAAESRLAAVVADDESGALDRRSRAALGEAARLGERRRALLHQVAQVDGAIAEARSTGLLRATEAPSAAAVRWLEAQRVAEEAWENGRADEAQAKVRDRELDSERRDAEDTLGASGRDLSAARAELDGHVAAAARIIGNDRVQALVPGAIDAWAIGDHLTDMVTAAVLAGRAESRSLTERLEQVRGELDAMCVEGLLPPCPDVRRVWEALLAAGIGATSGWKWLAERLEGDERVAALERNPGLAGGVLLTDPHRLEEARRALVEAGVETSGVVVLGSSTDLGTEALGAPAPVRPAQYDPAWTQRERAQREAEAAEVERRLNEIRAGLGIDEPLLDQVSDLLRRCPPTRRIQLSGAVERLEALVVAAAHRAQEARQTSASASALLAELEAATPRLLDAARRESARARGAADLAARAHTALAAAEDAAAAGDGAERSTVEAGEMATRNEAARHRAEERRSAARRDEDAAAALRGIVASIHAEPGENPPATEATEALKATAEASRFAYESERAGRDLTSALVDVEAHLAAHRHELGTLAAEIVAEAVRLAAEPAAGDEGARRREAAEARRALATAEAGRDLRTKATGAAERTLKDRTPADRSRHVVIDAADEPTSPEAASVRASEETAASVRLTHEVRALADTVQVLEEQAGTAGVRAQLLGAAARHLPEAVGVEGDSHGAAWMGAPEAAQEAASRSRASLDDSRGVRDEANRAVERATLGVRTAAVDPSHGDAGGLRVALVGEPIESLAPRAAVLATELQAMRASVASELADISRHREGLVLRLGSLVDHHLRLLARLTRLSILPDDLGGWSRRPFIDIRFDRHDDAELHARLEPVIDGAASSERKRRSPLDVLLAGMAAAVASGPERPPFKVSLLRPNRTMREERATVGELEREFSGGMKLTAAICTYCALSALRAGTRSTGGLFGSKPGPLFLDNPLGKASADYLLDLQHRLAAKLEVQLVHTTGVWDVEALGTYDRLVRLRNLADMRANMHRLKVDERVDLGVRADGTGVDGVGFSRRRG